MSDKTQFRAEHEGLVPVSELIAAVGEFYIVVLSALILAAAIVDPNNLTDAMEMLPIGDPALMMNFSA